jgi:nucleotide-binding universal stress UspA family protein
MTMLAPAAAPAAAQEPPLDEGPAPIVAAVDDSAASRAAVEHAVELGAGLDAPLVFVHVRRGPAGVLGGPVYKRRLARELGQARDVLDRALRVAHGAGVAAQAVILEGSPPRRIVEFAHDRGAQLVVVGSARPRLRRSVAHAVARTADRPVFVAVPPRPAAALGRAA